MAVDLDLEVQMGAGRQAGGADLADHLARRQMRARDHVHAQEMAVEQAHVLVHDLDHVDAGAAWIKCHVCSPRSRRVHKRAGRRSQVYPGMDVEAGQNGSNGSNANAVQPKGSVSMAPGTIDVSGSRW